MKKLLFILSLLACGLSANATIVTAMAPGGSWSSGATWDGAVPGCYDTIVIAAGASVTVDSNIDLTGCGSISVIVYGNLHFTQSHKLEFPCGSWVLFPAGPPAGTLTADNYTNNSKQLKICGSAVWKGKDGSATGPTGFGGAPLPISLLFFDAEFDQSGRQVDLFWATASETDNDYFTVERSVNGVDWLEILELDGAGSSSSRIDYNETDTQPLTYGDSYYRLKQTDINGEYSYSPIVRVSPHGSEEVEVYPNPVKNGDQVVINVPESSKNSVELNIFSIDGKLIYQAVYDLSESNQIIVDMGVKFLPGIYLIKVELLTAKLVVN